MHIDDPVVSRFVFHPRQETPGQSSSGIATSTASGGEILGGRLHVHPKSRVLMIFFHGNGEIAADYAQLAGSYIQCGVSFWVVDYRGYGRSTGEPSYTRMFTDAEAILSGVGEMEKIAARSFDRVVAMGRSLGSAPAIFLAASRPDRLCALVLDSPFADGRALIRRLGGPQLSDEKIFGKDNLDRIRTVLQPCLILHGTQDWIIPVSDVQALHEACPSLQKKLVKIDGAGHNELLIRGFGTYFTEITALIESIRRH